VHKSEGEKKEMRKGKREGSQREKVANVKIGISRASRGFEECGNEGFKALSTNNQETKGSRRSIVRKARSKTEKELSEEGRR